MKVRSKKQEKDKAEDPTEDVGFVKLIDLKLQIQLKMKVRGHSNRRKTKLKIQLKM